jgi:hypothetical protein
MKTDERYNGWTNYETWCVALWLDNDEYLQNEAYRIVADCGNTYEAEQAFKEMIDDMNPLVETATMFTDLLNAAISNVNWYEIIEHYEED